VRAWEPRVGRKPQFLENFPPSLRPTILNTLASLIEHYSPSLAAHPRREDELVDAIGLSMPKVLASLTEKLPFLRIKYPNLSASTLRHLFPAPHMGRNAAKAYKNLLEVHLSKGSNDLKEDSPHVRLLSLRSGTFISAPKGNCPLYRRWRVRLRCT
jgi:hypothetical protein